jgi:methylmalonyl-CoA/ethylmalonyl-CoA epimerase
MLHVHHVGYLIKKLDKAIKQFKALGYVPVSEIVYDEIRDVDIVFLEMDGYVVELVSPRTKESVVGHLMERYKNAPYHMCYESDSFVEDIASLEAGGYVRIDEPTPAPAIGGRNVCFLMGAAGGMIEILE